MSNQEKEEVHIDMPGSSSGMSDPRLTEEQYEEARSDLKRPREMLSSKNKTVATEVDASGLSARVQEQSEDNNSTLPKATYLSIKQNSRATAWRDSNDNYIFQQKTPQRNTVLHIAATYGNVDWVSLVAQNASELLTAKNSNRDIALHAAARAGHISILRELLRAHLQDPETKSLPEALNEILTKNEQGNTFIHEALLSGHEEVVVNFLPSSLPVVYEEMVLLAASFRTNNQDKSILYLAIEAGYREVVAALTELASRTSANNLIEKCPGFDKMIPPSTDPDVPAGNSPLLAALLKRDTCRCLAKNKGTCWCLPKKKDKLEILEIILEKKPAWIKLRDMEGRTPLHYAAFIGYLDGVRCLLSKCASCATERDNNGFFPLHFAAHEGCVKVVKELLKEEYCPYPRELLDECGRNFLHLAAARGKFCVVRYVLKAADNELEEMISDQDDDGNTPLHLATLYNHPKIVHALTWDGRVGLNAINKMNQTALDVCEEFLPEHPSIRQKLTRTALTSTGVKYADTLLGSIKFPTESIDTSWKQNNTHTGPYKDTINTLMLVSTLIATVTFAAGFTLPGGTNSSDPGQGMAVMLKHAWFHLFIFSITISMYSAIIVTLILFWALLGGATWAIPTVKLARLLLGISLATLSSAFLAGVHLVTSDLSWLATTFLVLCAIFTFMVMSSYIGFWLPSPSCIALIPLLKWLYYISFWFLGCVLRWGYPERHEGVFARVLSVEEKSNGGRRE